MTSRSTRSLEGSDLDYTGNTYEVRIEGSRKNPGPLDKVVSLLVKIIVGRED